MNHLIISYTAPMISIKRRSLKNLLLIHEIAFLLLVAVTGTLGSLSAFFWQETSSESVRINNLIYVTEQIRSELFRQIQQVIRARMLEDPRAFGVYAEYSRRIDRLFNTLRRDSASREEDDSIQALQFAYRTIQQDMNAIFSDPYATDNVVRMKILDPRFAERIVGVFEGRYLQFKSTLADKHIELDKTIERWTRFAPILIPVFFVLAVILVLFTRRILVHDFVRPMAKVMEGAAIIRQGQLQHRIPGRGVEEVVEIANSLNTMARELSSSRDALVESERQAALGALIPVVAHNIRNPLASIRATAQMLDDVNDKEELQEGKQIIMETTDRLGRWVSALVSYLHPLKPQLRAVGARHLLESSLNMLEAKIRQKNIHIHKQGCDYDKVLHADPDLMEQALYCLLANAVEASPEGGDIYLKIDEQEGRIQFSITDSGPGLPFEPKPGNLDPGPSTKKFGTGLGIPIAFKICQSHGWELRFKIIEQGTEVVITCPHKE